MAQRCSILFVFVLSFTSLFANDSTITWKQWKKSWNKTEIKTADIEIIKEGNSIKEIEVLDVRCDTERVGIYTNNFHNPCEIVFDASMTSVLNSKLCTNVANETILLVIRNFWINEVPYIEGKPKARQTILDAGLPSSRLKCSMDAFIKSGNGYFPLTQVDTMFTDNRNARFSSRNLMVKALELIGSRLEGVIISKTYLSKKQTDQEFIARVYSRKFKIPALLDSTLKKGIYYTWEQFKNNQPVEKEFSIKPNKNEPPSLFIADEKRDEILTRDVFAVSDGSNVYKLHQGFVFPFYRNNNGFYWMGLKQYDLKTTGVPAGFGLAGGWGVVGIEPATAVMKIRLTPYLLNLETGEEY